MSRPIVLPNKYGSPSAKLIEVECRSECQWYEPATYFCAIWSGCEDADMGPCGPSCERYVRQESKKAFCKQVNREAMHV